MTIEFSSRAKELLTRMQTSFAANQDWHLEQLKKTKPGQPLEYDPRFGMSREEYEEMLKESERRQLTSTGQISACNFRRAGDVLSLDFGQPDSPLSTILLNVVSGELVTSAGKAGKPTWSSSDGEKGVIGPYEAYSWTFDNGDRETFTGRLVKLDIFRVKSTGKILWHFQDFEMVEKVSKHRFEMMFQHSPPTPH